jgi:nonsense-mediated mRNA decay protein 3
MESPELLALCLRHIPALAPSSGSHRSAGTNDNGSRKLPVRHLQLADAGWVWTEPHSMRLRLRLTVRAEVESVPVRQTVQVEQRIAWQMCPDCDRRYTNREWQAVVQLRQHRPASAAAASGGGGGKQGGPDHGGPRRGLAALEMAIARSKAARKDVIRMDAAANGFDFYFLRLPDALGFASRLQRVAPMRVKASQKYVSSEGHTRSVANVKHTVSCDVLPLCRHDLVAVHRRSPSKLAGRLAIVTRVSSTVHLVDASPPSRRADPASLRMELGPDAYYKNEKDYRVLQSSVRLVRFVVLDAEPCRSNHNSGGPGDEDEKAMAMADVVVARESEWGSPGPAAHDDDDGYRHQAHLTALTAHLGHLLQPGDSVLGYDLSSAVGGDWELDRVLRSGARLPDVVLVRKAGAGGGGPAAAAAAASPPRKQQHRQGQTEAPEADEEHSEGEGGGSASGAADSGERPAMTKKMARRRRRREGKKARDLEESAIRMGFVREEEGGVEGEGEGGGPEDGAGPRRPGGGGIGRLSDGDAELAADVAALERELEAVGFLADDDEDTDDKGPPGEGRVAAESRRPEGTAGGEEE